MTKLYLSYGSTPTDRIHLDGSDVVAPVRGARYSPGSGQRSLDPLSRPIITEEITVDLAGAYRAITDWISFLSALVVSNRLGARHQVNLFTLEYIEPDEAGAYAWVSRILDLTLTLDPHGLAQRALGQQLVTLRVTRLDEWEYAGDPPNLYLPDASNYVTQGYLLNHLDSTAGHSNFVYTAAAEMTGQAPAKTYLTIGCDQASHALGDILIGCAWPDVSTEAPAYVQVLEGEYFNAGGAGVTRTPVAGAADCSGGQYATYAWSTTAETKICVYPSAGALGKIWHGRPIKPLLRLQAGAAYTDLWLKLKVMSGAGDAVAYETEWIQYQANSQLIEFPTLFCPPEGMTEAIDLDLALYAIKVNGAAYTLAFDCLQLWPVDGGFRRLKPLTYETGAQFYVDDGFTDQVYWTDSTGVTKKPSLSAQGNRIALLPNRANVLAVLNLTNGVNWTIDDQLTLSLNFNQVKWNL